MKIFGREFRLPFTKAAQNLSPVSSSGSGWWPIVRESFTGAWQSNVVLNVNTTLTYSAVFSCVDLIAADISKMRIKLTESDSDGIWNETESSAFSPVLRRPNRYQNRIAFLKSWVVSKLIFGNSYILKERDNRGVVVGLYPLAPQRVTVLVAPDGSVYYQLATDFLAGLDGDTNITVPATEVIHDVGLTLYHPLIGVSPLTACGIAAMQGLRIQDSSAVFFGNKSLPGGVLTAPGAISDPTAARLKSYWEENFSGANAGRVAVLGDGLKYEQMSVNAVDAQLIEQLKWSASTVASCFHVPAYMIDAAPTPALNNVEALTQQYYSQCLQNLIESIELCLDEGLTLPKNFGVELDLDALLRMDSATLVKALTDGIGGGLYSPNEGRKRVNLKPLKGGDTVYLQQQEFSLEALAKRDAMPNPFASAPAPAPATPPALPPPTPAPELDAAKALLLAQQAELSAQREESVRIAKQLETDRVVHETSMQAKAAEFERKEREAAERALQQVVEFEAKRQQAEREAEEFFERFTRAAVAQLDAA